MTYNPVSTVIPADVKAEAAIYSTLYQTQHDKHVRYSWILWAGVAAIMLVVCMGRIARRAAPKWGASLERACCRRRLLGLNLPTTRIQFLILALYMSYNLTVSFADIPYGHSYRYASKHAPGYIQKATTMQFIANRTGYLAFASLPLVMLMISRYSVISVLCGVSYKNLYTLHRWVGYTVFGLSWIHTMLWTIEMAVNYDCNGGYWATRWVKRYWIGGFFATLFMSWMILHSFPMVRRYTGYEFFRLTHNLGTILLLVGCWVHWPEESRWLIASIAVYYSDRVARWILIGSHYLRARGATTLSGEVYTDEDDVSVAIANVANPGVASWKAGDHIYLYCMSLGEWEPHPFSVANTGTSGQDMKLIVRQKFGMTGELIDHMWATKEPIKVLIDGPYGALNPTIFSGRPALIIVGGTGISFALSILHSLSAAHGHPIRLVWYIRRNANLAWIKQDLKELKDKLSHNLQIEIRVSRERAIQYDQTIGIETSAEKWDSVVEVQKIVSLDIRHREMSETVESDIQRFHDQLNGAEFSVLGCGPGTMGREITDCVERLQDSSKANIQHYIEHYNV